jgi:hypothetical protein
VVSSETRPPGKGCSSSPSIAYEFEAETRCPGISIPSSRRKRSAWRLSDVDRIAPVLIGAGAAAGYLRAFVEGDPFAEPRQLHCGGETCETGSDDGDVDLFHVTSAETTPEAGERLRATDFSQEGGKNGKVRTRFVYLSPSFPASCSSNPTAVREA